MQQWGGGWVGLEPVKGKLGEKGGGKNGTGEGERGYLRRKKGVFAFLEKERRSKME